MNQQYTIAESFTNKTLVITGGTGSFGSTVLKHFIQSDLGEIRILSRDEKKQDTMRHTLQARYPEYASKVKFYVGDVRNTSLLGGAIAIPMLAALVVQVIIGHTSTKTGDKVWHVAGALLVGAVGLGCSPLVDSMGMALFLVCLSAIGIYAAMGVWWTIPTTFLTGPAAAASVALINSCGNIGGWVGPNMMAWVQKSTGAFDLGYYIMAAFMLAAAVLVLTVKYRWNGQAREDMAQLKAEEEAVLATE